ncbi:iron-sulfur cluster biosynthesis family protein [Paenibacillus bouchesdurhonensis]|uniref:iron-sulfur cluster biosynthesis family protein n=1 Tax=Paenibacillus bouchesdurhonensis TaxID=1870990 RepID=UPI001F367C3E|nr:iron-sulfur cluster biosynthesis family protein [Paenibacillus bouchesdurhonensis]
MIKLEITPLAVRRLQEKLGEQPGVIKLYYDTEGCGCDGVNTLLIQNEKGQFDLPIDAGDLSFVIDQQHQIFYEDTLWLDAEENYPAFKLSSKAATYSSNVQLRDMRHATAK